MQVDKEFLEAEIVSLHNEMGKAQAFLVKAQGTIEAYRMLINRLETPEPEQDNGSDNPQ